MSGLLLLAGAAVLLIGGAELFVENAAAAAGRLGVTVLAVGILLAGAEPEELLTAVLASVQNRPGLAAGDAIGANVTMLTACLGLAALVRPLSLGRRVMQYAALSAVAGLLALLDGRVSRVEGALLVLAYIALVALVWWREREPPKLGELAELDDDDDGGDRSAGLCRVQRDGHLGGGGAGQAARRGRARGPRSCRRSAPDRCAAARDPRSAGAPGGSGARRGIRRVRGPGAALRGSST